MKRNGDLKPFSRQLRTSPTKEEFLLWNNFLRKYPLQFRRQYVIGNYIVDFYCHKAKLVIELDGSQHYDPEEAEKDFEGKGYGDFKLAVGEVCADALEPVRQKFDELIKDTAYLESILKSGAEKASRQAYKTLDKVYRKVGFVQI